MAMHPQRSTDQVVVVGRPAHTEPREQCRRQDQRTECSAAGRAPRHLDARGLPQRHQPRQPHVLHRDPADVPLDPDAELTRLRDAHEVEGPGELVLGPERHPATMPNPPAYVDVHGPVQPDAGCDRCAK